MNASLMLISPPEGPLDTLHKRKEERERVATFGPATAAQMSWPVAPEGE